MAGIIDFFNNSDNFNDEDNSFYIRKQANRWYISTPDWINDEDYIFIGHREDVGLEIPKEFEDSSKTNLSTWSSLSNWSKWIIVSNDKGLTRIGFSVEQSEEDIVFLNTIVSAVDSNLVGSEEFISKRIADIFVKLNDKEELTEDEVQFFSNYSSYCSDIKLVSSLRVRIVKQEGNSQFIANEFGIENFFSLDAFNNLITSKIKQEIDQGASSAENYDFEKISKGIEYDIVIEDDSGEKETISEIRMYDPSPEIGEHLLRLETINNGFGFRVGPDFKERVEITPKKVKTKVYEELEERAGRTTGRPEGSTSIPYQEIKNSNVYNNPTKYETFLPYRYDFESINKRKQDIYPSYLEVFYKPKEDKGWWSSGFHNFLASWGNVDTSDYPGLYDVVIGQYLRFVTRLEEIARDGTVEKNIGSYFNGAADEIYPYILNWIVVHYENLVRYNLAKEVEKTDADDLESKNPEEALRKAKIRADLDLQGLQGDLDDDELTEEEIEQRIQLYKQCALLLNIKDLKKDFNDKVRQRKNEGENELHTNGFYNNRFYMVEDQEDQISVKNKLISPSGKVLKPFLDITPDIASALRPRLRLYKVYREGNKTVSYEFPFLGHTDNNRVKSFKEGDIDRGDGVGIKSFDFSFDGETPATSQKYITANLSLFFQTFQDFVKERKSPGGRSDGQDETFRYVDLFVNTKHCPEDPNSTSPLHYDADYYRLRVDVGWEPRNDEGFRKILWNRGISRSGFKAALENMNKSFYLTLIDHEININETGTVNISANYAAYMESYLDQNNVLLSREAKELQDLSVSKYEEQAKKGCSEFDLAELRASINAIRVSSRKRLHESLIEKLVKSKCVYSVQVDSKDRKEFASNKFFKGKPALENKSTVTYKNLLANAKDQGTKDELIDKIASTLSGENSVYGFIMDNVSSGQKANNMETINFFYLADLVYFLLDSLYDKEGKQASEEQMKIILSSFSMNVPFTGNQHINIGEIPIEIEVFTKWYKDEIIDKELDSMSFLEFIRRITFYLITTIFSDVCIDEQQHKRLSFMTATINSIKDDDDNGTMESIMNKIIEEQEDNANAIIDIKPYYNNNTLPLMAGPGGNIDPTKFVQYLIVYPHHRPETHVGRAIALEDAKRGVHHLYIGSNKGILKNVSFTKSDIQYIREARMMAQGSNGLLQLSSLYRANIKMIGNTIFYPGMLLYLNPFGFGGMDFGLPHQGPGSNEDPNLSNIMGIGGYQKVVKVSSTISDSGKFETDVECIFEHTGEPAREGDSPDVPSPSQRQGYKQQNIKNITCAETDRDTDGSCNAAGVSKKLQDQLLNLNRNGTISLKDLKS